MLLTILAILTLQDTAESAGAPDTANGIWSLPNGVYAERHADGTPACDDPQARRIVLEATNIVSDADGGMATGGDLRLDLQPDGPQDYRIRQLISAGLRAPAYQDRMLSQIQAGRLHEGGLDSHVSGTLAMLVLTSGNGDITPISVTWSHQGEFEVQVQQINEPAYAGRLGEDGPLLRAFSRCGPAD